MARRKPVGDPIGSYLATLPEDKRVALEGLRRTVRAAAPRAEECISYSLPAFRLDGKVLVLFGATAKHCAFYPGSGTAVSAHADELAAYSTSKGAIRFQADKPLRARLVSRIVRYRIAENAAPRKQAGVDAPKLLSGGTPQVAKGDGDAPVQAYIAAMPDWKAAVGRRLDSLVVRAVPGVRKAVRWNTPFYGIDGRGWFLAFHCVSKHVKVAFFRGSALRPVPPVPSRKTGVRYFHVHEGDKLDESLLSGWIRQASALPGDTCF